MANTDAQPPTTLHALLKYVAKYASKPEKKSASYTELQTQILPHTSTAAPTLSFLSKMLNKLIGERDWSAQEVSHILLGIPMQDASRVTVTLDCRESHAQDDMIVLEDGTVKAGRSAAQRYQARMGFPRPSRLTGPHPLRLATALELGHVQQTSKSLAPGDQLLPQVFQGSLRADLRRLLPGEAHAAPPVQYFRR